MAISSIKNKEKENSNNSQFVFDAKDICEFFGVTRATLSNWVKKGAPKEEYGKYDLRELVKWRYSSGLSPEMRKIQAEADLKSIKPRRKRYVWVSLKGTTPKRLPFQGMCGGS